MAAAKALHVKSRAPSFWRAGIKFTRAGVDVDVRKITAEQLDAICAEPNLVVTETPPASESGRSGGAATSGKDAGGSATPQTPETDHPAGNQAQPGAGDADAPKAPAKASAKAPGKKAAR